MLKYWAYVNYYWIPGNKRKPAYIPNVWIIFSGELSVKKLFQDCTKKSYKV